ARRSANKVDMRCISNITDMLIPPQWATVQPDGATTITYDMLAKQVSPLVKGPCDNIVGRYATANPYDLIDVIKQIDFSKPLDVTGNFKKVLQPIAAAHTDPLANVNLWLPVVEQIARDTPKWSAANMPFAADLQLTGRSPFLTPGAETSIEVQLL